MDWTKGRREGRLLCSWQISILVVGAGSSLPYSPGRGREKCLAAQFPQGMGVKNTLLVHFLLCKHCMTAEGCVGYGRQSPTRHQKLYKFTFFPNLTRVSFLQGFGVTVSLEERRNISRVDFGRGWAKPKVFGAVQGCSAAAARAGTFSWGDSKGHSAPAPLLQFRGDQRSPSTIQRHLWLPAAHFSSCFPLLIPLGQ